MGKGILKRVFEWVLLMRFRLRLARLQEKLILLLCREALHLLAEVGYGVV